MSDGLDARWQYVNQWSVSEIASAWSSSVGLHGCGWCGDATADATGSTTWQAPGGRRRVKDKRSSDGWAGCVLAAPISHLLQLAPPQPLQVHVSIVYTNLYALTILQFSHQYDSEIQFLSTPHSSSILAFYMEDICWHCFIAFLLCIVFYILSLCIGKINSL